MKCTDCRKNEALDTRWERIRRWAFFKLFPEEIINLSQEKFTQGFGDGYKKGCEHTLFNIEQANKELTMKDVEDLFEPIEEGENMMQDKFILKSKGVIIGNGHIK